MRLSNFSLALTAFAASTMAQSYRSSCEQPELFGYTLQARCGQGNGGYGEPYISLNSCFGNDNGVLVHRKNGNAFLSCEGATLSGTVISSECHQGNGQLQDASIDTSMFDKERCLYAADLDCRPVYLKLRWGAVLLGNSHDIIGSEGCRDGNECNWKMRQD